MSDSAADPAPPLSLRERKLLRMHVNALKLIAEGKVTPEQAARGTLKLTVRIAHLETPRWTE